MKPTIRCPIAGRGLLLSVDTQPNFFNPANGKSLNLSKSVQHEGEQCPPMDTRSIYCGLVCGATFFAARFNFFDLISFLSYDVN